MNHHMLLLFQTGMPAESLGTSEYTPVLHAGEYFYPNLFHSSPVGVVCTLVHCLHQHESSAEFSIEVGMWGNRLK